MREILITGASGFVGSHLRAELERGGHRVLNYDIKEGLDILDIDQMERTFRGFEPEEVYHLAGSVYMGPAEEDPERDIGLNYLGTLNVLRMCEVFGCRLLYTGTGASYGISGPPHREGDFPRPVSNYGISKLAAELLVRKWAWVHGLDARVVRFSSVYGPGRREGPVNTFIRQAREQGYMTVYGAGDHTRDLLHIGDAVRGVLTAMERGRPGELYNIGSGEEHSVVEVAWIVHGLSGAEIRHVPYEFSRFDLPRSRFDISRARRLGYEPKVDLEQGIKELWELESR